MSRFHRVDDLECMVAERFFPLAERLVYYDGVVAARLRHHVATHDEPASRAAPQVPAPTITADNAHDVLANPLIGEVPGLAAVFSYSRERG